MALRSIKDLLDSPGLSPKSDATRISKIRRNKRLLNNDFSEFDCDYALAWPRRLSCFYGEFLLADIPTIQISNNQRMETWANEFLENLTPELLEANKNLTAHGVGILASHPEDPTAFESFSPDYWFSVCDIANRLEESVLLRIRGDVISEQVIDIYRYGKSGESSWSIHRFGGNSIGEKLAEIEIPDRAGTRQVAIMDLQEGSLLDLIRPQLKDLSKILGRAGNAVSRNLNPHLSGPSGALDVGEDGGKVDLSVDGEYLPRDSDDVPFEYVGWNMDHPMSKFTVEEAEKNLLIMSALSPLLFSPNQSGNLSGRSLFRIMLPFAARLGRLARENERTIRECLRIANENRKVAGMEYFAYSNPDVTIEWKYKQNFADIGAKEDRDNTEFEKEN